MPVRQDPIQVTPYTSTVPLVQVPPDAMEQVSRPAGPLQGQFGRKGTGALAVGDAILKGFMAGHQAKEQRKQAEAQATINAADASTEAAYGQYQDALTKAGGNVNDPAAQAAYQSYVQTFQAGKEAKAKFVIPEKPQKGQKAQQKKGEKGEKKTGFSNFRDFFEANPHIVPQIALMTMQPKPQGLAPQGQEAVQNLEATRLANQKNQTLLQNEQTYQNGFSAYAHLSPDEVAALPPDAKKGYEAWQNARAALTPMKYSGSVQKYKLPNGKIVPLYKEEAEQFYPDAELYIPGQEVKPGSDAELEQKYLQGIGKTFETASADELASATQYARTARQTGSTTTSTSTTDTSGNRTTTTTRTPTPGKFGPPPQSAAPKAKSGAGITTPPSAGGGKASAKGGMTPPPGVTKETWQRQQVTRQATKNQQEGYRKAESNYTKAIQAADKAYEKAYNDAVKNGTDPSEAEKAKARAYARAQLDLEDEKASVAAEYDAAVRSLGGTPGGQQQRQYRYTTEPNSQGVVLGSDDGQNWYDVKTGQQYQQ